MFTTMSQPVEGSTKFADVPHETKELCFGIEKDARTVGRCAVRSQRLLDEERCVMHKGISEVQKLLFEYSSRHRRAARHLGEVENIGRRCSCDVGAIAYTRETSEMRENRHRLCSSITAVIQEHKEKLGDMISDINTIRTHISVLTHPPSRTSVSLVSILQHQYSAILQCSEKLVAIERDIEKIMEQRRSGFV